MTTLVQPRQLSRWRAKICETAKRQHAGQSAQDRPARSRQAVSGHHGRRKIGLPATDCISPIGEQQLLKGLHHVVPGEFYVASTRPPSVYRGNPFQIEVALAYGGTQTASSVSLDTLTELLAESDARTLRQFLTTTFYGLGSDAADKILEGSRAGHPALARQAEKGRNRQAARRHAQRESRRRPDDERAALCQPRAAAIPARAPAPSRKWSCSTNWRSYGLSQSRGSLPAGPVTMMVHMASVWVPFTSESKEAIASYPEIQKELRLALQSVGRKLGMYLRRRLQVKQEGERRNIFLRYLGEVATAVSGINRGRPRRVCTNNC